jgi:hypothetical protein
MILSSLNIFPVRRGCHGNRIIFFFSFFLDKKRNKKVKEKANARCFFRAHAQCKSHYNLEFVYDNELAVL